MSPHTSPRFIDLSHPITTGMPTYPGLPAPTIEAHMDHAASRGRYDAGTVFHIARVAMVGNTGTYIDAPFHRYPDGVDIAGLPLERVADLPCIVADGRGASAITEDAFRGMELGGSAVLVRTDWSERWGTDSYFDAHPHLTAEAAAYLVSAGVALVGIDSLNIDDTAHGSRPVHSALLAAGIPVVEHLRGLASLPATGARFFAVPLALVGVGSFSVRAFARI